MKDGVKTLKPVALDQAERIFSQLVSEKHAKGYTSGEDGTPFHGSSSMEDSGIRCQLLTDLNELETSGKLNEHHYCVQQKFDGERRLIKRVNGLVRGINRKGLYVVLGDRLADAAADIQVGDYTIDGEQVGDNYHVFDILSHPMKGDIRPLPYSERLQLLSELLPTPQSTEGGLRTVRTAFAPHAKQVLFLDVRNRNGEGVVFKDIRAPYLPGRQTTGGAAHKFKFTASCSVLVGKVNTKRRSVAVTAFDNGGHVVGLGNVAIPINHPIPTIGQVVEIRYLYAYRNGSLYQPVYLGARSDIDISDCSLSQLKYKADTAA